ncbi:P-loop containing nucleoside triphosphate hydrolase protein [Pavlovales sp. CCMP2436]|nr:P-loop containing nucleoside triphosphate hydrolase protein [Pavlovales sp. CCMP2436]
MFEDDDLDAALCDFDLDGAVLDATQPPTGTPAQQPDHGLSQLPQPQLQPPRQPPQSLPQPPGGQPAARRDSWPSSPPSWAGSGGAGSPPEQPMPSTWAAAPQFYGQAQPPQQQQHPQQQQQRYPGSFSAPQQHSAFGVAPQMFHGQSTPQQQQHQQPQSQQQQPAGSSEVPSVTEAQKMELLATLRSCFGFGAFRDRQLEVIGSVIFHRRDVACFWATGAGKSLVYQVTSAQAQRDGWFSARARPCLLPRFRAKGQNSSMEMRAFDGEFAVVYMTPEKLASSSTLERLAALHVKRGLSLVAVDEAHCVSEWGHSFREDYRKLGAIRDALPDVPLIALTATATERVQQDVLKSLRLNNPVRSLTSADRSNLAIRIQRRTDSARQTVGALCAQHALGVHGGSLIIYCATTA